MSQQHSYSSSSSTMMRSSIALSPPPPFIPNQNQHQNNNTTFRSPIYFPTSSKNIKTDNTSSYSPHKNESDLVKHDITSLVSLKARQIDDLEEKLEKAQRDLKQSDELRIKWMERCSLLEEQLVEEAQSHTRELADANQATARFKSELQFVLRKLQEDDLQEEFLESIGATKLLEDVKIRRRRGNNIDDHENEKRKRFSLSPSRILSTKAADDNLQPAGVDTSTSISPRRFKSSTPGRNRQKNNMATTMTTSPMREISTSENTINQHRHQQQQQSYYSPSQVFESRPNHFYPPKSKTADGLNDTLDKLLLYDQEEEAFNKQKQQQSNRNMRTPQSINNNNNNNTIISNRQKDSANCFSPSSDVDDFEENENHQQQFLGHRHIDSRNVSPSRSFTLLQKREKLLQEKKQREQEQNRNKSNIQWVERPKPPTSDATTNSDPLPLKVNFFTQVEEAYFPHRQLEKIFTDTKMQTEMIPQKSAALQTEDLRKMKAQETQTNSYDIEADRELENMNRFLKKLKEDDERRARRDEEILMGGRGGKRGGGQKSSEQKIRRRRQHQQQQRARNSSFIDGIDGLFANEEQYLSSNGEEENNTNNKDYDENENDNENDESQNNQQDASASFWHKALISSPEAREKNISKKRNSNFFAVANSPERRSLFPHHNNNNNTSSNSMSTTTTNQQQQHNHPTHHDPASSSLLQNQFTIKPQDLQAELFELRATVQILKKELTDAKRQNFDYREKIRKMNLVETF